MSINPANACQASRLMRKNLADRGNAPLKISFEAVPAQPAFLQRDPFSLGVFTRMTSSSLIDADFLATEALMNPAQTEARNFPPKDFLAAMCRPAEQRRSTHLASPRATRSLMLSGESSMSSIIEQNVGVIRGILAPLIESTTRLSCRLRRTPNRDSLRRTGTRRRSSHFLASRPTYAEILDWLFTCGRVPCA